MRADHLFSIAPDGRFLDVLAERVLDGTLLFGWPREGPFWLSDVTIILPTRRARLALAEAFMRQRGNRTLLPDIRTFGGEQTDEEPFLPPLDAPPLPTAVSLLERRLVLARLIAQWVKTPAGRDVLATPPHAAEIFALADSLAEVLDSIAIEGADIRRLDHLEDNLELAVNWQRTREFLGLVLEHWPNILQADGKADAVDVRNERLRRQADAAALIYADRPVIAAGSTGSIAATARLLGAIADLPRGAVVLPGLDTSLTPDDHVALLKQDAAPHGHPQYGLARLLDALRVTPKAVTELSPGPRSTRTLVLRKALALAEDTARWAAERDEMAALLPAAAEGLAILAASTADMEARAIAIAAHDALGRKQTVAIVTPDQTLARRIATELGRFDIRVDDPAGTPLFQASAGRLARQVLAVVEEEYDGVALMALLRNRATTFGLERAQVMQLADALELRLLRVSGYVLRPGLAGLRGALAANLSGSDVFKRHRLSGEDAAGIAPIFDRLDEALRPLAAVLAADLLSAGELADALSAAVSIIAPEPLPGGDVFSAWADELRARKGEGPRFPAIALDSVLAGLMAGFEVRSRVPRRDDIHIWGRLEARLQSPGLMILCGLNEDIWPEAADPGPWLSRGMRLAIGLEPPERRHGLAAHDFAMGMGSAEVIVAYAERVGASPASPSRLLQRFEAFLGEAGRDAARERGARWLRDARRLDATGQRPRAAQRPAPRPPVAVRPKKLSVTEIEKLYRSPYDLYARHVLQLRAIDPLGQVPGGRERGTIIHDVLAEFIANGYPFDAGAQPRLEAMAHEAFAGLDTIPERREIWLRRFAVAARLFIEFERERAPLIAARHAEISGRWTLPMGFTLTGKADRVDLRHDGTLEILDFKTGAIPAPKDMKNFDAPQLLLEAAMAQAVGIGNIAPTQVSALTYLKIGSGAAAYRPVAFAARDDDLVAAIDEASRRLQGHVAAFLLKDDLPMPARIVPDAKQRFRAEFDHLARTEEWLVQEDEDTF